MPVLGNPRHERFAQELAKGKSASAAYVAAGFTPHRQAASRLLTNVDVADRVEELLAAGAKRAEVTVERVMREYARIGFADIRSVVQWESLASETGEEDEDGVPVSRYVNQVALVASDELGRDAAAAIAEISQTKDGALKVKLHNKLGALDSMARNLGMFVDRSEVKHSGLDGMTEEQIDAEIRRNAVLAGLVSDGSGTQQ